MNRNFLLFLSILTCSYQSYAAPADTFLIANNLLKEEAKLNISLSIDAVNDSIDFLEMRESENISDKSAGDYIGFNIGTLYSFHDQWAIEASYWQREIDYSKDTNEIESAYLGLSYLPTSLNTKSSALKLRASIWGNQSDVLDKTTPTLVNSNTIDQVSVNNPQDIQYQLDAIFSKKIDPLNQLNFFTNVGYSKVEVDSLDLIVSYSGCPYQIHIPNNNQFIGKGITACGADTTITGPAQAFNLDVQKDLNYESYYAAFGGSWNFRYRKFESQLAYQYQHLWRNDIDDRVKNFGNSPIKDNHTIGARFSYDFTPQITGFIRGEIYKNNFVGNIPFLYNGVTASRLDKKYGLASLGIKLNLF